MFFRLNTIKTKGSFFWLSLMRKAAEQIDYGEPLPELTPEFVSVWSRHYAAIAGVTSPKAPLLEIGTGFGILAAGLGVMAGGVVFGAEHPTRNYLFNPGYRRFLKNYGVQIVANDLNEGLPFADCSISQIYLCDVIEHLFVPDAVRLLSEIARVLPVAGELILSTPNINRLSNLFRFFRGYSINPPQLIASCGNTHGHVHEFAPKEITALLANARLQPVCVQFGLNPLFTASAFGSDSQISPEAAKKINRLTAFICRFFPGFGDQIFILARRI
jgi:SAM-dependent methyltransferase